MGRVMHRIEMSGRVPEKKVGDFLLMHNSTVAHLSVCLLPVKSNPLVAAYAQRNKNSGFRSNFLF